MCFEKTIQVKLREILSPPINHNDINVVSFYIKFFCRIEYSSKNKYTFNNITNIDIVSFIRCVFYCEGNFVVVVGGYPKTDFEKKLYHIVYNKALKYAHENCYDLLKKN
jgi:hypothetical protein